MSKKVDKIISLLESINEKLKMGFPRVRDNNHALFTYSVNSISGFMVKLRRVELSIQTQRSISLLQNAFIRLEQERGVKLLEFSIPEFSNMLNSGIYQMANFIAKKYERVKPIIQKVKSSSGNSVIIEFSAEEQELNRTLESLLNQLRFELYIFYEKPSNNRIKIRSEKFIKFMNGDWLEIYTLSKLYKLIGADMVIVKSLKYQFYGSDYEVDVIVFDSAGNIVLLLENKSSTNREIIHKALEQIESHAKNLGIDISRCFVIHADELSEELEHLLKEHTITLLNFKNMEQPIKDLIKNSMEVEG